MVIAAIARARTAGHGFSATVGSGLKLGFGGRFLVDQGLPVGDGDLIVIGVNFVEGQEAVAIAAVINECSLERWLHACDFGEIDIATKQLARSTLEVEFFYPAVALHHHPGFLGMCGVDEHFAV